MKKITSIFIVAVIVLGLSGCGTKIVDPKIAEYGQSAVDIAEDALNGIITLDDAVKKLQLQEIHAERRLAELEEESHPSMNGNYLVKTDIHCLGSAMSSYSASGSRKQDVLEYIKDLKKDIKR